mgnify:FL=1
MAKLTLAPIIKIHASLAARAATRKGFDTALILGTSEVIPQSERVRVYYTADDLISDGFTDDSAEYKAAKLYFSATETPTKLYVGAKYSTDTDLLTAARACRSANSEWYVLIPLGASEADVLTLADWAESAQPVTILAYTTGESVNLSLHENASGTDADQDTEGIFRKLKAKGYRRSFGQYCNQPDTPDAVAATMGYAMGANDGTINSAYTLAYKHLPGVTPDDLTENQVSYVVGTSTSEGVNGNVYINRQDSYNVLQQGRMADGTPFDEIIYLDMLMDRITLNVMDLLYKARKIPDTDPGVTQIMNVINNACDQFVNIGYIAPGVWKDGDILKLKYGDTLAKGYLVQAESVDNQSQADRENRLSPPIYVSIKLAGAIEYITIPIKVNR